MHRDSAATLVRVVVPVARHDVQVGAAQADRGNLHQHLVRRGELHGDVAHLDAIHVDEDGGAHGSSGVSGVGHTATAALDVHAAPAGYA